MFHFSCLNRKIFFQLEKQQKNRWMSEIRCHVVLMHESKRKTRVSGGGGVHFNIEEPGFETVIGIRNLNAGT